MPKFDYIIGNPPYDGNLHLKILDAVKDYGEKVIWLHPAKWFDNIWKINPMKKYIASYEYIDISKSFKDVSWGLGMISVLDGNEYEIQKSQKEIILEKLKKKGTTMQNLYTTDITSYKIPVVTLYMNTNSQRNVPWLTDKGNIAKSGYTKAYHDKWEWVCFKTENELNNFKHLFTNTIFGKLVTFLINENSRMIKFMPVPDDYTKTWTNERLYDYFNLTPEEIAFVENEIKKMKLG